MDVVHNTPATNEFDVEALQVQRKEQDFILDLAKDKSAPTEDVEVVKQRLTHEQTMAEMRHRHAMEKRKLDDDTRQRDAASRTWWDKYGFEAVVGLTLVGSILLPVMAAVFQRDTN